VLWLALTVALGAALYGKVVGRLWVSEGSTTELELPEDTAVNHEITQVVDLPGKGKGLVAMRDIKVRVLYVSLPIDLNLEHSKENVYYSRNRSSLCPTKVRLISCSSRISDNRYQLQRRQQR
jgi:hypothetical protein